MMAVSSKIFSMRRTFPSFLPSTSGLLGILMGNIDSYIRMLFLNRLFRKMFGKDCEILH